MVQNFVAREFAVMVSKLELELLVRFVAVYRYAGRSKADVEPRSGWIVCGNVPFLTFNDDEITTPIEALALYSWFLIPWLDAKGNVDDSSVPVYRVPPTWAPLTVTPGYEEWRMGAVTAFFQWKLVRENASEIIHPEIRERCSRRGWL